MLLPFVPSMPPPSPRPLGRDILDLRPRLAPLSPGKELAEDAVPRVPQDAGSLRNLADHLGPFPA
jgi:hypothetical protein